MLKTQICVTRPQCVNRIQNYGSLLCDLGSISIIIIRKEWLARLGRGADGQSMSVPTKLQSSSPTAVTDKDLQQRDGKAEIWRRFEATHSLLLQNERRDYENVESMFLYHIKRCHKPKDCNLQFSCLNSCPVFVLNFEVTFHRSAEQRAVLSPKNNNEND